jgi:hypothetical protein
MADYIVKEGTIPGPLDVDLSYSDGTAPDLTGASLLFRMRPWEADPFILERAGSVVDATTARLSWQAGDFTGLDGLYQVQVRVTFLSGSIEIFPADETHPFVTIWVQPSIAAPEED